MLKKKAISGVKWSTFSTLFRVVLQIIQLSIVARFLPAEAIGLYAFVQVVMSFSQLFIDMGLGNAIIHKQETLHRHLSELFTINLLFSFVVIICVMLAAPLIGIFFQQANLSTLVQLISITFLFAGIGRIHLVLLQKSLCFNVISIIELVAATIGFVTTIVLIFKNVGVIALIWGYIANSLIQNILYLMFSSTKVQFCLPLSWRELSDYLKFGAYQTADAVVNFFNSSIDIILVGKLLGVEALGGYSLVRQFCFKPAMIINPVITKVTFPVMAKLQGSEKLGQAYAQVSNLLASINFPLYGAMAVFAEPIIALIFGEKWLHLTPILQIMAIWCLVRSTMNPVGSLMMATGKVRVLFLWNATLLLIFPLCIYLGAKWNVLGVALALMSLQILLLPGHAYVLLKRTNNFDLNEFAKALLIPLLNALLTVIVVIVASGFITDKLSVVYLMNAVSGAGLVYVLLSIRFNRRLIKTLKMSFRP